MKSSQIVFLLVSLLLLSAPGIGQDLIKNAQQGLLTNTKSNKDQSFDLFTVDLKKQNKSFKDYLSHSVILDLNPASFKKFRSEKSNKVALNIPVNSKQTFSIVLEETTIHSDDYIAAKAKDNSKSISDNIGKFYHGKVEGDPNSKVAVSVFNDYIRMLIIDQDGNYVFGKLKDSEKYILYNDQDILVKNPFKCGAGDINQIHNHGNEDGLKEKIDRELKSAGECVDIYVEADFKTYQDHGNSVTNVENFISALINEVSLLYEYDGEVIHLHLDSTYVHTSSDPYAGINDAFDILSAFGNNVQNSHNANLAHFISTRPIFTSIAWQDVLCSSYSSCCQCPNGWCYTPCSQAPCSNPTTLGTGPYAVSLALGTNVVPFPTYSWSVNVFAHEMGHNFGSPHTQDCAWGNGSQKLDNCYGGSCSTVSPAYGGTIMSYCHLTGTGVDFNLGFGQEPWDLIYGNYASANCTSACPSNQCAISNLQITSGPSCNGSNVNITLQFAVSNGSGNYQAELWGGVVSSFSGTTNGTVTQTISVSVAPGNTSLNVKESGNNSCADNVAVTIPNCSPCDISNLQVTSGPSCSGNNQTFNISFSVANGSGNYTAKLGNSTISTFSGVSNGTINRSFNIATNSGNQTLTISDTNDSGCSDSEVINFPNCGCGISNLQVTSGPACSGNNVSFNIFFNASNTSGSYRVKLGNTTINTFNASSNGNIVRSYTVSTSSGNKTLRVEDVNNTSCADTESISIPDCNCSLSNLQVTSSPSCSGNNVTFDIQFSVANGSGSYGVNLWGSNVGTITGGANGTLSTTITVAANSGNTTLEIFDASDPSCSTEISISLPDCISCSISNIQVTSGPDCNSANNTFVLYFDVHNGSGDYKLFIWNSQVATIGAGTSGTIGPVAINTPLTGGVTTLRIQDDLDSACQDIISFTAKDCTGGCPSSMNVNNQNISGIKYEKASGQINSLNTTVMSGGNVVFDAGSTIELSAGFEIKSGAVFHALIDGCN